MDDGSTQRLGHLSARQRHGFALERSGGVGVGVRVRVPCPCHSGPPRAIQGIHPPIHPSTHPPSIHAWLLWTGSDAFGILGPGILAPWDLGPCSGPRRPCFVFAVSAGSEPATTTTSTTATHQPVNVSPRVWLAGWQWRACSALNPLPRIMRDLASPFIPHTHTHTLVPSYSSDRHRSLKSSTHPKLFPPPDQARKMTSLVKNNPRTILAKHQQPTPAPIEPFAASPANSQTLSPPAVRTVNAFRYAVPMPTRAELLREPMLPDGESALFCSDPTRWRWLS